MTGKLPERNVLAHGVIHLPEIFWEPVMRKIILALILSLLLSGRAEALGLLSVISVAEITNNEIILNFPETATFRTTITGEADITSVVLEYGNEQQTCGEVIAKAYPQ